jgi:hypothetical protein
MTATPKTKALRDFMKANAHRVTDLAIESDGVWIYTDPLEWCDEHGAGTFRGDSESAAIRRFRDTVRPAN